VRRLAANHEVLITVEEGSIGGFGSQVFQALSDDGLLDGVRGAFKFRSLILPDAYIDHDKHEIMIAKSMLDSKAMVAKALELLGDENAASRVMIA
jgi:1-deoxy-D-xylulose-5-phosphate synthase